QELSASLVVAIALLFRQPAQREHGPRLAANPAPILTVLSKLESSADLFQIPLHFECGERALGGDAIETHRSFDDQDRDDRGLSWHRVPPAQRDTPVAPASPDRPTSMASTGRSQKDRLRDTSSSPILAMPGERATKAHERRRRRNISRWSQTACKR